MSTRDRLPVLIGARRYATEIETISWLPHGDIARVQDNQAEPGEQSIENLGLWNRSAEDFILGAGQRYFDLRTGIEPSVRERFRWSKGLDVLTDRRQAKLLPTVTAQGAVGNGNTGRLVQAGTYLYAASGTSVERSGSDDPETWSACTGEPGGTITDMVAVGGTVYVCDGANVSQATGASGDTSFSAFSTLDTDYLIAGPGRLLGLHDNSIWEFTAAGAQRNSADIHTHFDSNFAWKGGHTAPNGIYVFGDAGNHSEVYLMIPVDATGDLPPPYPVMETPQGELIRAMKEYAGVIVFATNKGVRLAQIGAGGVLSFGPLVELGDVLDVAFDGKFAYATLSDFKDSDGTTSDDTGLAVLGLDRFTRPLTPSWASFLMIGSTTGTVRCVNTLNGRVVFGVDDTAELQLYVEDSSTKVANGYLRTGGLTFGTVQFVALSSVEIDTDPLPDGSSVDLNILDRVDSSDSISFGTHEGQNQTAYIKRVNGAVVREESELEIIVNRGSTTTADPVLRRWTVRAIPMIRRSERIDVPVKIYDTVALNDEDQDVRMNKAAEEISYLRTLAATPVPVTCEIFGQAFMARVEGVRLPGTGGFQFEEAPDNAREFPTGTWLVRLETLSDAVDASV